eukprot:g388.t1
MCITRALLFALILLLAVPASAHNVHENPPVCKIEQDYSSTGGVLRTAIFEAQTKLAAKILSSNLTFGLGDGLTYSNEQSCAVRRTKNKRREDPDIVALQALALSAKYFGESEKLANAIVLSFELPCQLFTPKEQDEMVAQFKSILEDYKALHEILMFGESEKEEEENDYTISVTTTSTNVNSLFHGRRLEATSSSPTNSFVCAYCEPADVFHRRNANPLPTESVCRIEQDFSTTENKLRTLIFNGDTNGAAKILSRNTTFSLGAGLTYLEEQTCAVVRTEDRRQDPDIVALQAVALSAKRFGEAEKLANAIVLSFELPCQCSLFDPAERDRMAGVFRGFLEDPEVIQEILEFGVPSDHSNSSPTQRSSVFVSTSAHVSSNQQGRRRLRITESSPTNSFICAYCDPSNICNPATSWCPSR